MEAESKAIILVKMWMTTIKLMVVLADGTRTEQDRLLLQNYQDH